MAKIMDIDFAGDGYNSPFMQMKDTLLIDGLLYNTSTLYTIPFKSIKFKAWDGDMEKLATGTADFNMITGSANYEPLVSSGRALRGRSDLMPYGGSFIVDSADSSVGYHIQPTGNLSSNSTVHKLNLDDNTITNSVSTDDPMKPVWIVGQNATKIFIMGSLITNSYYYGRVGYIDKATLEITVTGDSTRYVHMSYITESADSIYFAFTSVYNTPLYRIWKYNKTTGAYTQVATLTSPSSSQDAFMIPSQKRVIDADTDAVYQATPASSASDGFEVYKSQINKGTGTAANTQCSLDFATAGTTRAAEMVKPTTTTAGALTTETWLVSGTADDYVCFGVTENPDESAEPSGSFLIYVFMIDSTDTDLIYIGKIAPSVRVRNFFPVEDDWSKIAVVHDAGLKLYEFNNSTETYDWVQNFPANVQSVAKDKLERIWVLEETGVLSMFSATTPTRVSVTMASETYNYTGTTINTSADVSAWDVNNNRIVADVKLILEGSAEFADASQSKTIATSASAETNVAINITGSSSSRVIASVVV